MKPLPHSMLTWAFLAFTSICSVNAQNLNLQWSRVEFDENLGSANLISRDIDADGQEEVIFDGGNNQYQHVFVCRFENNELKTIWASRLFNESRIVALQVENFDQDADSEIYVVLQDGTVEVYDGFTRQLIQSVNTGISNFNGAVLMDMNQDGNPEIALISYDQSAVYDFGSSQTIWSNNNVNGSSIVAGDVDGDGATELVISNYSWNGGAGYVLSGTDGSIEWQYFGGFGSKIGLADTNGDHVPEILGLGYGTVTIFDGNLHSPIGQFNPGTGLSNLAVTDYDHDGHEELLIGDGEQGTIYAYSAETKLRLWELTNPNFAYGLTNISTGDPDGDGKSDVIWGSASASSSSYHLYIYNIETLEKIYESKNLDGAFSFDAADLNKDQTVDFIVASKSSNNNYDNGHVLGYNSITKDLDWDLSMQSFYDIRKMHIFQSRSEQESEIVVINKGVIILDGKTREILFSTPIGDILDVKQADLDGNGKNELVIAIRSGDIYSLEYDGDTYKLLWNSITFPAQINGFDIINLDGDPAPEIIFSLSNGVIDAIDGKTKLLQWQIPVTPVYQPTMTAADLDLDGTVEILYTSGTQIYVYNSQNQQLVGTHDVSGWSSITAIAAANLDSSARKEILVYTDRLRVIDSQTFTDTWQSGPLGETYADGVSLIVKDLNDDQHVDVLLGTITGAYQFSTLDLVPDVVPPRIISYLPANWAPYQSISSVLKIKFSERLDTALLNTGNIGIKDRFGNTIPATCTFDTLLQELTCLPDNLLSASDTISVILTGLLADLSHNTLDGNNNGVGEGSPSDDFIWHFSTGSGIDNVGPLVVTATLTPTEAWPGIPVKLEAQFSDLSTVASSGVAGAEYFIDQPGISGQGVQLTPVDGFWDGLSESSASKISTDILAGGDHPVFIHARDLLGNWGDFTEKNLKILQESVINWPMYGQNPQHTNYNSNCALEPPLKIKWAKNFDNRQLQLVTYANGNLLAPMYHLTPASNAVLHCLDTLDGSDKWSYQFGNIFSINPAAYAYGGVYIQTCNNNSGTYLSSFNLSDGTLLWQSPFGAQWETYLSPTVAEGRVFINGGTYGGIYCFDAVTGEERWFNSLQQFDRWTPAYYNKTAYAFAGGFLSAHKAASGQQLWNKELAFDWSGYTMNTAPVIDTANNLIFTTSTNYLHAVRLDTHEISWFLNGPLGVTPALKNGVLYVVRSGKLEARNAATGVLIWTFIGDNQLSYPPAVTDDYLYVSSDNNLYAVDINTGAKKWSYPAGGSITLAENLLVLTNPDNVLRVFEHGQTSAVQEQAAVDFNLKVTPNPVVDQTQINFSLPRATKANITISDLSGKQVAVLGNENYQAGEHFLTWNPQGLAAGVYRCSITADGFSSSRKIVVIR